MRQNPPETAGLVTFTEETFNGKFRFLCSVTRYVFGLDFLNTRRLKCVLMVFSNLYH